jgi:hypothetical protein
MESVAVPKTMLNRIDKTLQAIHQSRVEWINRQQVCDLFGWTQKTLSNNINTGRITADMYIISPVNGVQFFDKAKLLGL